MLDRPRGTSSVTIRFSVEVTVENGRERRGIGSRLDGALLVILEARDVHVVVAGIVPPNEAHVAPAPAPRGEPIDPRPCLVSAGRAR